MLPKHKGTPSRQNRKRFPGLVNTSSPELVFFGPFAMLTTCTPTVRTHLRPRTESDTIKTKLVQGTAQNILGTCRTTGVTSCRSAIGTTSRHQTGPCNVVRGDE
ncbi:hypothetical protein LZ32DRAFT_188790 [Colletotrichum eremochloae]|nr:hypothetical protein LZ32DRAFT_188790 [Colletotrichum eremochloae]